MEGGCIVGGWQNIKREILLQRAARMEVQPADIEARGCNPGDSGALVNRHFTRAYPVPDRSNAERDRPIPGILPNRSVTVVHELVPVIFEFLAKIVQHGPGFMTRRAAQSILPGKCRQSIRVLTAAQDQEHQYQSRHPTMFSTR